MLGAHVLAAGDRRAAAGAARPRTNIRVDSQLVLIPVTVTDPLNRPVTGLDRGQFRLFDNKVEQDVVQFAMDDAPLAVGLIFDISGSMGVKLRRARMAVREFFKSANPEDEFLLVEFNERARLVTGLTHDAEEVQNRLAFTQAGGRTALLDAIYLGLQEIRKSTRPRKALLVLSDGGDNSSRYTETEVRNLVRESDTLIYAMGILESAGGRGRSAEELAGPGLLNDISEQTGGRYFAVEDMVELLDIAARIGVELRNRYVLGFNPKDRANDGRYHKVNVKVMQPRGLPPLKAYWRTGYYAPAEW